MRILKFSIQFIVIFFTISFILWASDTQPVQEPNIQPYFTIIGAVSGLLGSLGGTYAIVGKWLQKFVDNQDRVLNEIKQAREDIAVIKAKSK
ncbi:MAG: hypothetical protein KDH96_01715 [Candidatus Riesia sp.]|nr:hypothetical protein [Candidatus Riesia sp.]